MDLPESVEVVVEVPRFGFVKRGINGGVDYVSPLPSPFNYGSVPDVIAEDGDHLDAVLLGPRIGRGTRLRVHVIGVVRFTDAGVRDDKLVCGPGALTRSRLLRLLGFFHAYAVAKRAIHAVRGQSGPTRCDGFTWR